MSKKSPGADKPTEISFDYIKSHQFRVVHVDGAFGGLSPNGRAIHMALFSERRAIPTKTVHALSETSHLGNEIREKRTQRDSFIRELEIDLVLDFDTAVNVQKWLQDKIDQMSKVKEEIAKATAASSAQQSKVPADSSNGTKSKE